MYGGHVDKAGLPSGSKVIRGIIARKERERG